jgi:hypothetical protein
MMTRLCRVDRRLVAVVGGWLLASITGGIALAKAPQEQVVVSRNVNMVSGTMWPAGDPYLQRQNEPSLAASTRNPLHLLGGANDYRTVDLPFIDGDEETGDAWLGVFKSFDGGQRWRSDLLPGYPQDVSPLGLGSPLHGYQAGADPVVRAGTNGLIYYAGIVFDRAAPGTSPLPPQKSAVFVSRFIDNNNIENGDSIAYLGASLVARDTGATGRFLDKPWLAVDVPRGGALTCRITTPGEHGPIVQTIPAGAAYVAYTIYSEDSMGPRAEIVLSYSTDCGATWSPPAAISRAEDRINQGATIAIAPRSGAIYVAWRRIASAASGDTDAILVSMASSAGKKFSAPGVARKFPRDKKAGFNPARYFEHKKMKRRVEVDPDLLTFDQSTSGIDGFLSFRTNAYPSMTIDGDGRVYVAWAERGYDPLTPRPDGDARIVVSTSLNGKTWTTPVPVAVEGWPGHQLMPTLTFAGGRLVLVYYDLREDVSGLFTTFIDDTTAIQERNRRHTLDLRTSFGTPGERPVFLPSARVSDYLFGTPSGAAGVPPYRLQYNPPNLPMFKLGTSPFMGDYVDVAASPVFVQGRDGQWTYNTAGAKPVFHAVWTDNRDVRPPADGNWRNYTPPTQRPAGSASVFDPTAPIPACNPATTGSRNQNIYTASLTMGLLAGSPGNSKPLSATMQRAFVVFAQNQTYTRKAFRLSILGQPQGGHASFDQFDPGLTQIDVTTPPRSTASRSVYATSTNPDARIEIGVAEITAAGGGVVPGGLSDVVVLNPDISNPDISNPDISNPDISNPDISNAEVYNPDISNPDISNPDISNPDISNPDISNPDISNPDISNPDISNPTITAVRVANPDISNPDISNPDISNPDISNPDISNPDISNATILNGTLTDVTWAITNTGNTTAVFNVDLFLAQNSPKLCSAVPASGCIATQLIIRKVYTTPVATACTLQVERHNVLITNITNPKITSLSPTGPTGSAEAPEGLRSWQLSLDEAPVSGPGTWLPAAETAPPIPQSGATVGDPNDPSANNASLWLAPGDTALITLRIIDPDRSDNLVIDGVSIDPVFAPTAQGAGIIIPVAAAQSVSTPDVEAGVTTPTVVTPSGSTIFFLKQPTGFVLGSPIPPVKVQVRDAALVPQAGVTVTAALGANPGLATLSGTRTATTDANGEATFGDLLLSAGGSGYTLVVSAAGVSAAATSAPFSQINSGPVPPTPMTSPRFYHTATLLDDGRVLVAGGDDGTQTLTSAETYSATTGAWTLVGSMASVHYSHTATKLANGRVLIAGGYTTLGAYSATAELFDPVTNNWSPADSMSFPRALSTSTRLADGRVLVAGGENGSVTLGSAEIYDPAANTWTSVLSMNTARAGHTAVALPGPGGRVLVAGGQDTYGDAGHLSSAEIYDPAANTWTTIAPMSSGHSFGTATALFDGSVLVLGGESQAGVEARGERFEPGSGTWTPIPPMATPRESYQAVLLSDGRLLAAGGLDGDAAVASVEIFDPVLPAWSSAGSMVTARFAHALVRMQDGRILMTGGYNFTDVILSSVEVWSPVR